MTFTGRATLETMSAYTTIPAPWGSVELTARDGLLWQINFSLDSSRENLAHPQELAPWVELIERTLETSQTIPQEAIETLFALPRMQTLSEFSRNVLFELTKIPAGHFKTYQQLATVLGNPKASRAVARALAANPFVILLPCQRIASKASLLQFDSTSPSTFVPKAFGGRQDFVQIGAWLRINDLANAI